MIDQLSRTALLIAIALISGAVFLFPSKEKYHDQLVFMTWWWEQKGVLSINELDSAVVYSLPISASAKKGLWYRISRAWSFKDLDDLTQSPLMLKDSLWIRLGQFEFVRIYDGQNQIDFKRQSTFLVKPEEAEAWLPVDVNKADSIELMSVPGIGAWTANQMISYRLKYGYIADLEHLKSSTYLKNIWREEWDRRLLVENFNPTLSLNKSNFKELLKFPELNYIQVKRITFYRETFGDLKWPELCNWKEFEKVDTNFLKLYINE
jgi:hypothetical protein|tara:strand:- start:231 stop:1022 length:792 start_codon:yes stop_codon:yes gene_type:complete